MDACWRFLIYMLIILFFWMILTPPSKAETLPPLASPESVEAFLARVPELKAAPAQPEKPSGWWAVATVRSYHHQRNKKHNEDNWGLGVERNLTRDWTAAAGFYDNSYDKRSVYAGMIWAPVHVGHFHFGLSGGIVDGYEKHPFSFFLFPIMAVQGKNYGINLALVPSVHDSYTVIGLQLKTRF